MTWFTLDKRKQHKATVRLDEDLCKCLDENFDITRDGLTKLIRDALWHFITCPTANGNAKTVALTNQRTAAAYEARLTRLEKLVSSTR